MVKKIIKRVLNEVFQLSQEEKEKLKDKFKLSFRHQRKGNETDKYNKILKYTFKSEKYKFIVDIEQYELDFYLISFYPKLNLDFEIKQDKLRSLGRPHHTKYSYQTKEQIPFQIFNLLITMMEDFLKENPMASFGFFGAPNVSTGNETEDFFNTKRLRIYDEMIRRNFSQTHEIITTPEFSGGRVLNKKVLEVHPELIEYSKQILRSHV